MAKREDRATTIVMTTEKAAEVFAGKPLRVTLGDLDRRRGEDAARGPAGTPAATALATLECSAPAIPQGPCPVCPRLAVEFEPWRAAAYWKSMHERAKEREHLLQQEKQQLEARVRYLEQQLYGRKSESARSKDSRAAAAAPTTRIP